MFAGYAFHKDVFHWSFDRCNPVAMRTEKRSALKHWTLMFIGRRLFHADLTNGPRVAREPQVPWAKAGTTYLWEGKYVSYPMRLHRHGLYTVECNRIASNN